MRLVRSKTTGSRSARSGLFGVATPRTPRVQEAEKKEEGPGALDKEGVQHRPGTAVWLQASESARSARSHSVRAVTAAATGRHPLQQGMPESTALPCRIPPFLHRVHVPDTSRRGGSDGQESLSAEADSEEKESVEEPLPSSVPTTPIAMPMSQDSATTNGGASSGSTKPLVPKLKLPGAWAAVSTASPRVGGALPPRSASARPWTTTAKSPQATPRGWTSVASGPSARHVVAVRAGGASSIAIVSDGTVYAWGSNCHGQLGFGHTRDVAWPEPIPTFRADSARVTDVAMGKAHTVAVSVLGNVYVWGLASHSRLGLPISDLRALAVEGAGDRANDQAAPLTGRTRANLATIISGESVLTPIVLNTFTTNSIRITHAVSLL